MHSPANPSLLAMVIREKAAVETRLEAVRVAERETVVVTAAHQEPKRNRFRA